VTNPIALNIAGGRWLAVVHHKGRRSGKDYKTPVLAAPFEDGFLIPLTYGDHVDWCQNVLAAGGGALRWRNKIHQLVEPSFIMGDEARSAFSTPIRQILLRSEGMKFLKVKKRAPVGNEGSH
jgi:deazaflavin-dependent oxidoreductase (nitroreductase family)